MRFSCESVLTARDWLRSITSTRMKHSVLAKRDHAHTNTKKRLMSISMIGKCDSSRLLTCELWLLSVDPWDDCELRLTPPVVASYLATPLGCLAMSIVLRSSPSLR